MSIPQPISAAELDACLAVRDLTDPRQGGHALQILVDEITGNLADSSPTLQIRWVRESPITTIDDNYERLGYPADSVTRETRHTRYVDERHLLRTSTTAMIPPALRELAATPVPDALLAAPGVCYRRDSVDWQHTGTPQQLDLWRLTCGRGLDDRDLVEMIGLVVAAALPGRRWRTVPATHSYTLHGRQIDVWYEEKAAGGAWVEIGECGLAGPTVLDEAGLAPAVWSGLAMGLGLDRLLMLRKGIPDIRLLRSSDPRVVEQLLDLTSYRPVSHLPPVRRDLSVVVGPDVDASAEALGDRVRLALGDAADTVETLAVLSTTAEEDLPEAARDRLRIDPGQRNLLLRLVLRPLDRTLTDGEANLLRDRVYAELHEGSVHEWAASGRDAAVEDEVVPDGVTRLGGGEEQDRPGHLVE